MGNALKDQKDYDAAISMYKKVIEFAPDFADSYNSLATSFQLKGVYEAAAENYNKALTIWGSISDTNLPKYRDCTAKLAECLYEMNKVDDLNGLILKAADEDPANIRLASLCSFITQQWKQENVYPFCREPLKFLKVSNIKGYFTSFEHFSKALINDLNNLSNTWEPADKTTRKGFQTKEILFETKNKGLQKLKRIITKEINDYHALFKENSSIFITHWPEDLKIKGWYVRLLEGGHQDSHIHPGGWLSGVVYLKTIDNPIENEGSIEFGLHGYNYSIYNDNHPKKSHSPNIADLVLFPSCLFHKTIPILQKVERNVIAFDLIPNNTKPTPSSAKTS